ncbi:MAG: hypothetical protein H6742_18895 [Alphaproteobacteria bacterium]|nr:hypothetical protein [Alphaproteobacteria bacterium]
MLLLALLLPAPVHAAPDVLVLGNSYVFQQDVDQTLQALLRATAPGWQDAQVTALTAGGLRFTDHLARTQDGGDPAWRTALVTGDTAWAAVVMQDQSQIPGFPQTEPTWLEDRDAGVALDDLAQARGATTVLELTWGRRDGDSSNPDLFPDFATMQDRLTEGYLAFADAMATAERPVTVGPAGLAFAAARDRDTALFEGLYSSDGSHPSATGGYLAAAVLSASITGWPVTGAPELDGVDADTAAILQALADGVTVDDPFGPVPFAWAVGWADWEGDVAGDGLVRPTVGIVGGVSGDRVTVGGAGAGRLWVGEEAHGELVGIAVEEDGLLQIESGLLSVDEVSGGAGVPVRLDGGALTIGQLTLADTGVLQVAGGSLDLGGGVGGRVLVDGGAVLAGPDADLALVLDLVDGLAALRAPVDLGGLSLSADSELQLVGIEPGEPAVEIAAAVTLAGLVTPSFSRCEVGDWPVLVAATISWSGEVDGYDAAVVDLDDGQALQVTVADCDGQTDGDTDGTAELDPVGEPDGGCGCGGLSPAGGLLGLLGWVGVTTRRRRHAPVIRAR